MGDVNADLWVQFVREVAAGVVAVIGALAAYRWGVRRRESGDAPRCDICSARLAQERKENEEGGLD